MISLIAPVNGETVPLLRSDWKQLTAARKGRNSGQGGDTDHKDNLAFPEPVQFSWDGGKPPFRLQLESADDRRDLTVPDGSAQVIWNLLSGTEYRWKVTDSVGESAQGTFSTGDDPRLIRFPNPSGGPVNFRDLGGRRSQFGGKTRQGILYRGSDCHLDELTFPEENRLFMTGELKIRTELDMRYQCQVDDEKKTESSLGPEVRWFHIPVNAYDSFTPEQNLLFAKALRIFAVPENYPLYFHCSGGVDRTGEIAFLLNALAGVDEEDCLLDYEMSSLCWFPRARTIPYFQEWRAKIASFSPPGTPLSERVENYLLSIGLTPDEIGTIRKILLRGT